MDPSRGSYGDAVADDFISGADSRARQHERTATERKVMLNVRVDPELRRQLKRRAVEEDRPMAEIITGAIERYLARPITEAHGLDEDDDGL